MIKDRARPYSRKHLKYWLPVMGGMLLIGGINVGLGVCTYHGEPEPPREKIIPVVPAFIDAAPAPRFDAAPPVDGALAGADAPADP